MKKIIVLMAMIMVLMSLVGCASRVENIPTMYVSEAEYEGMTCIELRRELVRVERELGIQGTRQEQVRRLDGYSVQLGFIPAILRSGGTREREARISSLKGEAETLRELLRKGLCE